MNQGCSIDWPGLKGPGDGRHHAASREGGQISAMLGFSIAFSLTKLPTTPLRARGRGDKTKSIMERPQGLRANRGGWR